MPSSQAEKVEQMAADLVSDFSNFSDSLWAYLVAAGVDPGLENFFSIKELGSSVAIPLPTPPPPGPAARKVWGESGIVVILGFCWLIILCMSRRAQTRAKITDWQRTSSASKHLDILRDRRSFENFCREDQKRPAALSGLHNPHRKIIERHMYRKLYGMIVVRAVKEAMIAGWRFIVGFGLFSLSFSCMIRGARWATYKNGDRVFSDLTIDANLAGCHKVLEVLLPLTCFVLGLFVFLRLRWLTIMFQTAQGVQRYIVEIALVCCNVLPHHFFEEVATAKWLLYRYMTVFHLFAYADASPQLKFIVYDEMMGGEAFSKVGLLTVDEEEEISRAEDSSSTLLLWISHLVMEIGNACDSERPCAQQLLKALVALRSTAAELSRDVERATPLSFIQLLHLMTDFSVILTPLAVLHKCGVAHEGYSMYFIPFVCTVIASIISHACLRLIMESADPFGADLGQENITNDSLMTTEAKLFALLSVQKQPKQAPIPRVRDDSEPNWASTGLGWNFASVPAQSDELEPRSGPQAILPGGLRGLIPGLDDISVGEASSRVPGEDGYDDDYVSLESDLNLSDVDPSEAAEMLAELRNKPPVFNEGSRGATQRMSLDDLEGIVLVEDTETKAKLEESEKESALLRQQLKLREKQVAEMQATTVPTDQAAQVLDLLKEWVAPPRPVRLSDVTLAKLSEISRKQTSRVKKILAGTTFKLAGNKAPGQAAAELSAAKASADYRMVVEDLLDRLNQEEEVHRRLKTQLDEASKIGGKINTMPHASRDASRAGPDSAVPSDEPGAAQSAVTPKSKGRGMSSPEPDIVQRTESRSSSRGLTKDGRLK